MLSIAPAYDDIKETLRLFRNAMFHVQKQYWSPKLMNVFEQGDIVDTIRQVHTQVGAWVEGQLRPFATDP